ncbi:DUF5916 domain-containing protein [Sediminibacterium soli]|uniref:DUF5916 domain-containing protein n=1 Tax=Sediminibacterium soli TaxID=2698829 RepID=UPI00137B3620|nr:DUF5916 domain-containing protein [Sediminibacterium soli]NCI47900.1 carbohydrate binding family 9 domain-containing protein [Sediminibacterium soli]
MKPLLILTCAVLLVAPAMAQQTGKPVKEIRKVPATRTSQKITIDGDLKDSAWLNAPAASDFVEWRPAFGNIERAENRTVIKILYDNNAIYVGGYCHMPKDSISSELVGRDRIGSNDYVGVLFDTYNDKINGFGYYVTPLGEQYDAKYSSSGEDDSWNSVYETQARIVSDGWVFEMRIPYAAIRFATKNKQDWGLNITRRNQKSGKQYMWSPTDPTVGGNFLAQFGLWTDIENIKPPIRLSFSPYFSTYANHYPYKDPSIKNLSTAVNGGMDVKYGISQAFTLDMTLIPDFGQVQSDNRVLNLTPFEVKYNENRSFFTEGTELFSKGNLFYSRRIGGEPLHYGDVYSELKPGESITRNPTETRLYNATKISGRTSSGLGIGVFNAVTKPQYATVEYNGKEVRRIETDPLTNYNIIVLDQSLKRNSSVSLINTNVTRAGKDYDANVTAALWDLYDKKNDWNLSGKLGMSHLIGYLPDGKTSSGYTHKLGINKTGGRLNMSISQELADQKYNANDMGYFTNNNFIDHYAWVGYKWIKPTKWYNRLNLNFNGYYSLRNKPWDYQSSRVNVNFNGQLKSLHFFGVFITANPAANDFYEPRKEGYVFKRPGRVTTGGWFESNYAKKFSAFGEVNITLPGRNGAQGYEFYSGTNYRFNKKLSVSANANISLFSNTLGFATISNDSVIVALRKRYTVENVLSLKYNFTNKMGLTFRARHYWSSVDNRRFFNLQKDGSQTEVAGIGSNPNYNVNYFNIDMVYTWQFALGSFLNIVWKNSINTFDKDLSRGYFKNFGTTIEAPQLNSLSLRVIYFLDYLSLRKK